ncbi:hypothetical protein ACH42_09260 [Endozoicomonas sp. (ex Bugula neritina AB1)]|nr:hypothetical protein ACH42_09260 [Endozoicomonas sp. (ex Bugula neritina AB1)]
MKSITLALSLSVLAIAGCSSTPSPQQLADANNWEQLGLMDGQRGDFERTSAELIKLKKTDAKNITTYQKGYAEGIAKFCDTESGFFLGRSGFTYQGQCASFDHEKEFIQSWEDGYIQFESAEWDRATDESEFYGDSNLEASA